MALSFQKDQVMLALLGMDSDNAEAEPLGLQTAAEKVDPFFDDIKNCIDDDTLRRLVVFDSDIYLIRWPV